MSKGISGGADLDLSLKSNTLKYFFIFFILLLIVFMSGHLTGYRYAQRTITDECNKYIEEKYGTNTTIGKSGSLLTGDGNISIPSFNYGFELK